MIEKIRKKGKWREKKNRRHRRKKQKTKKTVGNEDNIKIKETKEKI